MASARPKHGDNSINQNEVKPSNNTPQKVVASILRFFSAQKPELKNQEIPKLTIDEVFRKRREYRKEHNIPLPKPKRFTFSPVDLPQARQRKI